MAEFTFYMLHIKLIGKPMVDFLLAISEVFLSNSHSRGTKKSSKSAFLNGGLLGSKL